MTYHVTAIRNGSLYGHSTEHCDPAGCNGHELHLGGLDELWTAGNNAGEGYAPDQETVAEAVAALEADGYRVIRRSRTDDEIAVLRRDDEVIGIGDANGAWAVDLVAAIEAVRS